MKKLNEILKIAKNNLNKTISVACAHDKDILKSIKNAIDSEIVDAILVGDAELIRRIANNIDLDLSNVEVIDEKNNLKAVEKAVKLVVDKKADIIMKGLVDTKIILKEILKKENNLRTDSLLSHVAVFSVPTREKVMFLSDAAINIAPNQENLEKIITNTYNVARKLNFKKPRIALLSAVEKVNDKIKSTVVANQIVKKHKNGDFLKESVIEGPLALDIALSKKAVKIKNVQSEINGDSDILIVPYLEAGNVLYKSITYLSNGLTAGIVVGAKVPIVLTSRADSSRAKLLSIALSTIAC